MPADFFSSPHRFEPDQFSLLACWCGVWQAHDGGSRRRLLAPRPMLGREGHCVRGSVCVW